MAKGGGKGHGAGMDISPSRQQVARAIMPCVLRLFYGYGVPATEGDVVCEF